MTRFEEIKRETSGAYPVATAVYIGPQSARILKNHGFGYVDLSGNCHLAFENVLIEKEGKPLTDSEIVERLKDRGIHIARRTVAKYRMQLAILPSSLR